MTRLSCFASVFVLPLACHAVYLSDMESINGINYIGPNKFVYNPQSHEMAQLKEGGDWLIFYGARWCHFTQALDNPWLQVQERLEQLGSPSVRVAKIECDDHQDFCDDQSVFSYPTILYYRNGEWEDQYQGDRTAEAILAYLETKADDSTRVQMAQLPMMTMSESPSSHWNMCAWALVPYAVMGASFAFVTVGLHALITYIRNRRRGYIRLH